MTTLYRRAGHIGPHALDRPAVVQSRIRTRRARSPFCDRWWLVVSPWPIPGHGHLRAIHVATHAEGVALAVATSRAREAAA